MEILGIDIGGSGIKGAPVDTENGLMLAPRYRLATPQPSKPVAVTRAVVKIARHFKWEGLIGCGFPAAVRDGKPTTAANIHPDWIGADASGMFSRGTNCRVIVINDADAAGLAEMKFGSGQGCKGVTIVVTIGTGLGTALFTGGMLLPNAELGHIELKGRDAELFASDAARKKERLSWKKWGKRFDIYLLALERLLWPDLIILGGGVSKKFSQFSDYLTVKSEVQPAKLLNDAGIVGAAIAAEMMSPI